MPALPAERILGLSSVDIAFFGALISVCSLLVTVRLSWKTKFAPAKLIGALPYVMVWNFFRQKDGELDESYLLPRFWLTNIGANPMLVADMRVAINPPDTPRFNLYPVHSIDAEAIESPQTFNKHEHLRDGKAPFGGFSVSPAAQWSNEYAFLISTKQLQSIRKKGAVKFSVEIRPVGKSRYQTVLQQYIQFENSTFDWMEWAGGGGPIMSYYYSEELRERLKK